MKVFVTGSSGFVGTNLLEKLGRKNIEVITFDFADNPEQDITALDSLIKFMPNDTDVVVHLASKTKAAESLKQPVPYLNMIIMGTTNVLEAMRIKGIKRLVYISSCGVKGYLDGNPYLWAKKLTERVCEMYTKLYGIEVIILRPTVMYGPHNWKGVVHIFTKLAKEGKQLKIFGDGSQTRDFLHVSDSCDAIIKAINVKTIPTLSLTPQIIEIGNGRPISIKQLAEMVSDNVKMVPSDKVGISSSVANIDYAENVLGWKPKIRIEDAVKEMLKT